MPPGFETDCACSAPGVFSGELLAALEFDYIGMTERGKVSENDQENSTFHSVHLMAVDSGGAAFPTTTQTDVLDWRVQLDLGLDGGDLICRKAASHSPVGYADRGVMLIQSAETRHDGSGCRPVMSCASFAVFAPGPFDKHGPVD